MSISCVTVAAGATLVALSSVARAQATLQYKDTPPDPRPDRHVLFSISGGISLGSYQAGMNWALLELYRAASADLAFASRFRLPNVLLGSLAGASAGNINTLLWAIEGCTRPARHPPDSSLFWKTWTSVGLAELLPRGLRPESSDRALFDRGFFKDSLFPTIRRRLRSPDLQPGCSIRAGVTLTRVRPDTLRLGDLPVLTQRFAVAFRAEVDTTVAGPRQMRFVWPDRVVEENRRFGKLVLPMLARNAAGDVLPDSIIEPDSILAIVEASSAFPIAFQPKRLTLHHPEEGAPLTDLYMDGGVFDNNPLGLAVDLFADANREVVDNDSVPRADVVSVIYVTPGRYRGPLADLRVRRESALAWGGIKATMQMLAGAVETAQQYELQLTVRQPRIVAPDTLVVQLTSRAHPITGEHLAHFGAFLARPFRELDFFVGVYDALHFVGSEYTCDPAGARQQPDSACVAKAVAELIAQRSIDFGAAAPPLLDSLFATEFHDHRFAAMRESVRRGASWGRTFEDSARTTVLLALHGALQKTQMTDEPTVCGNIPLPHLLICTDRLQQLLHAFGGSPGVRDIIARWSRECDERARTLPKPKRAAACQSAHELDAMVKHPRQFASRVIDRLLVRLWDVEHRVHRDFKSRARGEDSLRLRGIDRLDAELQAALLLSLYRARPLRPRYGFEWSPTSAPERAWIVRHLVPYTLAFNVGDSGFELGYRPSWHLHHRVAVTFPLTAHWTTPVIRRSDGTVSSGDGKDFHPGGGLGIALSGLIPRPVGLIIPELGITTQYFGPTARSWSNDGVLVTDVYGDVSLLAGRLRVGVRKTSREDQLFDGGAWAWSVGIADLNGLAYWLVRLTR